MYDGGRRATAKGRRADIVGTEAAGKPGISEINELLNISTHQQDAAVRVVADGELDVSTAPLLEAALIAAEATPATTITLDIDGISFIDSTGLRTLLEAHARSQQDGDRIRLTRGSPQAQRLFALAAVDLVLPFVDE